MSEYRRKTLRSFYCEEQLWKAYEKLARDRDTTIDQLLSDALQQYLDGGSSAPAPPSSEVFSRPAAAPALVSDAPPTTGMERPTQERLPPVRPAAAPPPPPRPAAPRPTPPPAPAVPAGGGLPRLFLHYGGRVYPIQQERFVIGRGSKGTDLTIRDGNISRKHSVVIFHNGSYYVQDLGSTNGIEYNGQRVDTKIIEEGDVFTICDHELTFSYRG